MINSAIWYRNFGEPEQVLKLENGSKPARAEGNVRVEMLYAPVNASNLIPVTGAYRHRITLPLIAGYEGVGRVTDAPAPYHTLIGQRVLPLRGEGTWQKWVDCPAHLAIPVPDAVDNSLAARAYINPLAASLMLDHFSPAGKHVLITAAGSDCALLLGQWALKEGALSVTGVHRSAVHAGRLSACGILPVQQDDLPTLKACAALAEVVYDATGGSLAEMILEKMPKTGAFITYGLLSGQIFRPKSAFPKVHWFHINNYLPAMGPADWQQAFRRIWPLLLESSTNGVDVYPLYAWQDAIAAYRSPGRTAKPLIEII